MLTECSKFLVYWVIGLFVFVSTSNCYCQVVVEEEVEETEADGCYVTVNPACTNAVGKGVFPEDGACTDVACVNIPYWDTGLWITYCSESAVVYAAADTYSDTVGAALLELKGNRLEIEMPDKNCGVSVSCRCEVDEAGNPPEKCKDSGIVFHLPSNPVEQKQADVSSPVCPDDEDDNGNGDGVVVETYDLSSNLLRLKSHQP